MSPPTNLWCVLFVFLTRFTHAICFQTAQTLDIANSIIFTNGDNEKTHEYFEYKENVLKKKEEEKTAIREAKAQKKREKVLKQNANRRALTSAIKKAKLSLYQMNK